MQVIFCQPTLNRSGSENSLLQMVMALREASPMWSISVMAGQDGAMRHDFENHCRVDVVNAPKLKRHIGSVAPFLLSFMRVHRFLREQPRGDGPLVVYVNSLMFPQATLAARLNRLPVVVHVREVASTYPHGVYRLYMLLAALCAKTIVGACRYVFEQPQFPTMTVGSNRREVIYNTASGSDEFINRLLHPPYKILAVIPCTRRKGILDLVKCVKYLGQLLPPSEKFEVEIIGKIAERHTYEEALRQLAKDGNLSRVRFHGEVRETASFFRKSQVLLHPSHSECFPRVLVEACGFSLPCVATDVGGVSEIIVDGHNGYLAPVGAARVMAERLRDLLINADRYARQSRNAFRVFQAKHSTRHLAQSCVRAITNAVS
jgi:glycosyltransferase involved in cell wall biosynthesis